MKKVENVSNNKALNALMVNYVSRKDIICHDLTLLVNRMVILGNVSAEEFEKKLDELIIVLNRQDCLNRFMEEEYGTVGGSFSPEQLPPEKKPK